MSVLSCSRHGCDGIMCDYYVPSIGYICSDCKDEFKIYLQRKSVIVEGPLGIEHHLEEFMDTVKVAYSNHDRSEVVDEFFNEHSRYSR